MAFRIAFARLSKVLNAGSVLRFNLEPGIVQMFERGASPRVLADYLRRSLLWIKSVGGFKAGKSDGLICGDPTVVEVAGQCVQQLDRSLFEMLPVDDLGEPFQADRVTDQDKGA
jgi:hypothetical protein